MEIIKPQQNQNIFDIALQEYGSIETVFDLIDDNDITKISAGISVYDDLKILREPIQREVVAYYLSRGVLPATEARIEDLELIDRYTRKDGINFMKIQKDFEIGRKRISPEADITE